MDPQSTQRSSSNTDSPHKQFLRLLRLTILWMAVSWLLFSVQHAISGPLHNDPFQTPTSPFQAVSTHSAGTQMSHPATIEVRLINLYRQVAQVWWYSGTA